MVSFHCFFDGRVACWACFLPKSIPSGHAQAETRMKEAHLGGVVFSGLGLTAHYAALYCTEVLSKSLPPIWKCSDPPDLTLPPASWQRIES